MISDYKKKLIAEGALNYLTRDNGSGKVYFNKTLKEAKSEIKKMNGYSSPRLYSRKKQKGAVLVFNMALNCVTSIGYMNDLIIQANMKDPDCVVYYEKKV